MAPNVNAICFLGISLRRFNHNNGIKKMKKVLFLIVATVLFCVAVSCSDDEPGPIRTVFTVNTPMVNHMVDAGSEAVIGIASTYNKLTLDTVKRTASLELNYNTGNGDKQLIINDIKATPNGLFYTLTSPSNSQFSGYADFSEGGSMRYRYVTDDGIRIISTIPEVFFRKTHSTITYDDTTATSTSESTMYQFTINPANQIATIEVMDIVHAKDLKDFKNITANNVPITITPNGFTISGTNLRTNAKYTFYDFSTGSSIAETDKYPFKTFNATIDLVNDHLDATYMIGGSATVVATGKTYPD
jgi:hypothetical protein